MTDLKMTVFIQELVALVNVVTYTNYVLVFDGSVFRGIQQIYYIEKVVLPV